MIDQKFIEALTKLQVPRAEDLPYWTSPPIQFVYESTASLSAGAYVWADNPSVLTPPRPLIDNAVYFFRNVTLTADIEVLDFTANLVTSPEFFMFRESDSKAVLFREPIIMNTFYQNFEYRFWWASQRTDDQLFAAFRGSLVQGSGLIGKTSITLKAIVSATEVVDDKFIDLFKKHYQGAA